MAGRPEIFMDGMHGAYRALALIVFAGALLTVVREIMGRRAREREQAR